MISDLYQVTRLAIVVWIISALAGAIAIFSTTCKHDRTLRSHFWALRVCQVAGRGHVPLPRVENGVIRLAASQLMVLVEGIDWTRVRAERR